MKKISVFLSALVAVMMVSCNGKTTESADTDSEDKDDATEVKASAPDDQATEEYLTAEALLKVIQPNESMSADRPVVIDFNATWCGPCRQFGPTFEKVGEEYASKAIFMSIDVDQRPEVAQLYSFDGIPCVTITYPASMKREPVLVQGLMSETEFKAFLDKNL